MPDTPDSPSVRRTLRTVNQEVWARRELERLYPGLDLEPGQSVEMVVVDPPSAVMPGKDLVLHHGWVDGALVILAVPISSSGQTARDSGPLTRDISPDDHKPPRRTGR